MKKILFAIVLLMLVLSSSFAYTNYISAGFGYQFKYGEICHSDDKHYTDHLFDFGLEYQGEWENGLTVYERVDAGLSHALRIENADKQVNFALSTSCGVGYSVHNKDSFRLSLCIGPRVDMILYGKEYMDDTLPEVIDNIGVELNINASVNLNKHLALTLSVIPTAEIYNFNTNLDTEEIFNNGLTFGLSALATAGLTLRI